MILISIRAIKTPHHMPCRSFLSWYSNLVLRKAVNDQNFFFVKYCFCLCLIA